MNASAPLGQNQNSIRGLRWWICGLLFFATTINYLDRQSLSVLKTTIEKDFGWSEADYGWITFSFQTAYAIFFTIAGRIIDRVGVKVALGGALILWSLMAGVHAIVSTTIGFCIARFLLGAAESFNFPASIKAVAQWHPQRERALSTGIFNSGSNVGIILAAGVAWVVAGMTPAIVTGSRALPGNLAASETLNVVCNDTQSVAVALAEGATLEQIVAKVNETAKANALPLEAVKHLGKLRLKASGPAASTAAASSGMSRNASISVASDRGADVEGQLGFGATPRTDTGYAHAWRLAFVIICVVGFLWLIAWLKLFNDPRKHPRVSQAELALIEGDRPPSEERVRMHWTALLRYRQVWPFLLGKFLTDPVWWFYLYWLPSYLEKERGLSLSTSAMMLIIPYVAADVGSIMGGWISGHFIKKGWPVGSARYLAMGLCAICMPGAIVAASTDNFWLALALISLAASGHQGWSANIFTTGTDLFPSKIAGSVIGLGGTTGAIGGMLMTLMVGMTLQWLDGSPNKYLPIFIWAGTMHLLSLAIYWMIVGKDLKTVDIDKPLDMTRPHRGLLLSGVIVGMIGAIAALLIGNNWAYVVGIMKTAAAAAGLTAMIGIALIGIVLIYAGLPKHNTQTQP